MTTKKHMCSNHTSKATATRDLKALEELGIFIARGGGGSRHYFLNLAF